MSNYSWWHPLSTGSLRQQADVTHHASNTLVDIALKHHDSVENIPSLLSLLQNQAKEQPTLKIYLAVHKSVSRFTLQCIPELIETLALEMDLHLRDLGRKEVRIWSGIDKDSYLKSTYVSPWYKYRTVL